MQRSPTTVLKDSTTRSRTKLERIHQIFGNSLRSSKKSKQWLMVNADVARLIGGQAPAPKRRKYKDLQKRIKTIITQYNAGDRSLMDTMEGLAFAFMF